MSTLDPRDARPGRGLAAPLLALGLVLSACGDSDGSATEQPRREGRNDMVLEASDRTAEHEGTAETTGPGGDDAPQTGGPGGGDGTVEDGTLAAPSGTPTGPEEDDGEQYESGPAPLPLTQVGVAFVMPSENVACAMAEAWAACRILERDYEPALQDIDTTTCPFGSPDTLLATAEDGARWVCSDSDMFGHASDFGSATLEYGDAETFSQFRCLSDDDGVQCANDANQGFRLARGSYDTF